MKPVLIIVAVFSMAMLFSCRQSNYTTPVGNGEVKMIFSNNAGSTYLTLGNTYTNEHGDNFQVGAFKYYISNIKLTGPGVSYTEPNSYHLIDQNAPAASTFIMYNMQYGTYNSITFTIGVDSAMDVSGVHTGDLAISNGMFLSLTDGYIMVDMEGTSPASTQPGNILKYHTTGYYGANTALRTVTLSFPSPISVTGDATALHHVTVVADVVKMFKSPHVVDFSTLSSVVTAGGDVSTLADDYANMFSVASAGL